MNHLEMTTDRQVTWLTVKLNGVKIEGLISMKAEIPEGDKTPLMIVRLAFYSALDVNVYLKETSARENVITLEHPYEGQAPNVDTETNPQTQSALVDSSRC